MKSCLSKTILNILPRQKLSFFVSLGAFFVLCFCGSFFLSSPVSAFSVSTTWYTSKWETSSSSGQYASDTSGIVAGQATPRATSSNSIGVTAFNVWFTMPSSFNLSGKAGAHFSVTVPLYPSGGTANSWGCLYPNDITAVLTASGVSSTRTVVKCTENHSDPNNVTVNLFAEFDLYPTSGTTFTSNPEINVAFSSSQPFIIFSNILGANPNNTYLYFPRSVNIYNDRLYTDPTSAGINQMVGLQSETNSLLLQQIDTQQQANEQQQEQYDAEKQEESDRESEQSDSIDQLSGIFSFNVLNPFASIWGLFSTGSTCVPIPTLSNWLHLEQTQVCPFFPSKVISIVTPVLSISSMMLLFGFFVRWLGGGAADNSLFLKKGWK